MKGMFKMDKEEVKNVKAVRGDGVIPAIFGGYDEKLDLLSDQVKSGFQELSAQAESSQAALAEMKAEVADRQQKTADSIASQLMLLKRSVDDLSGLRYFERENPVMLEVIQSLCAMPREEGKYAEDAKLLPRLLRLLEDLEVSLERAGLSLTAEYTGHASRFEKIFKADVAEPRVLKPCILRGEAAVLKGTAVVPESEKQSVEPSKPSRDFEAMDIGALA